ncbi:hypothetical protein [Salinibacterium sp. ZJ450]|uniref:hypothetical protein n=1 Tax=Salinibacterium sp. ZJ450 TaxID=2708338 RepID=UPI00142058FC|nr:hypothetical protein [Salinibacterium sp. ZJ450]
MTDRAVGDDADARARFIGNALAAWRDEGAEPDDTTKLDVLAYAMGGLSSEEVIRRARERYGLAP